ncbi:MAG: PspC domain-containing protein [Candidatus Hydrogenedentes bacterium]|nr:PspC domain-containing protein [Candidatus Hydrogenedentota bacterium]
MPYPDGHRALYRSRRGLLFGVCRGLAERFALSVFWTRVVTLIAFVVTGFWPVGAAYLLAALLLKREPGPWEPAYRKYAMDAQYGAARACRRAADGLDARLRRVEAAAARDMDDWDARLRETP